MTYSLRRIVCSDEDSHIILSPGRENLTDIVRDTNMFFKINVAGKTSRGRLVLTYSPGQIVKRLDGKKVFSRHKIEPAALGRPIDLRIFYSSG